mgnify:CR=1 FL=1
MGALRSASYSGRGKSLNLKILKRRQSNTVISTISIAAKSEVIFSLKNKIYFSKKMPRKAEFQLTGDNRNYIIEMDFSEKSSKLYPIIIHNKGKIIAQGKVDIKKLKTIGFPDSFNMSELMSKNQRSSILPFDELLVNEAKLMERVNSPPRTSESRNDNRYPRSAEARSARGRPGSTAYLNEKHKDAKGCCENCSEIGHALHGIGHRYDGSCFWYRLCNEQIQQQEI